MRAIETTYAGCRFRSRLEAKWAVFLDSLEVHWEYEAEGLHLANGVHYLPDFWLPEFNAWIEVKGQLDHTDTKWRALHDELMAEFDPLAMDVERRTWEGEMPARTFMVGSVPRAQWAGRSHEPETMHLGFGGFMLGPGSPHSGWAFGACETCGDLRIGHVAFPSPLGCHDDTVDPTTPAVDEALRTARSKRFEHDERSVW